MHELLEVLKIPAPSREDVDAAYDRLEQAPRSRKARRVVAEYERARAEIPGRIHELKWTLANTSFALEKVSRTTDDALFWGVVNPDDALRVAEVQHRLAEAVNSGTLIAAADVLDSQVEPALRQCLSREAA